MRGARAAPVFVVHLATRLESNRPSMWDRVSTARLIWCVLTTWRLHHDARQIVHPIGANNVSDMFPPEPWDLAALRAWCSQRFESARMRPLWLPHEFGLGLPNRFAASTSRIVFAYGTLDPWATMAISEHSLSPTLPVVSISGGSHCADMAQALQVRTTRGLKSTID